VTRPGLRDWDAASYDRVSVGLQRVWGLEVLERLPLRGDEIVLDAGCGTGGVTAALLDRLPRGGVIAVDASPSMVEKARETIGDRADVRQLNLVDLDLDEEVDAIFSNAVFHWIDDHDRLFERLYAALRPGGRLVAQCGGKGNVASLGRAIRAVADDPPFAEPLRDLRSPWNFVAPDAAAASLARAGFDAPLCWLEPKTVQPEEPREFLRTLSLGPYLERMPADMREAFVEAVVSEMDEPLTLDYVTLNIEARRPE
jgi:trans-aconitate 2-methyltransferase